MNALKARLSLSNVFLALVLATSFLLAPLVLSLPFAHAQTSRGVPHTFSGSISSEATIATPATGKKLIVHSMILTSSGAGVVVFKDNTAGTTILNQYLIANTPFTIKSDDLGPIGLRLGAVNHVLTATLSGATLTTYLNCDEE